MVLFSFIIDDRDMTRLLLVTMVRKFKLCGPCYYIHITERGYTSHTHTHRGSLKQGLL